MCDRASLLIDACSNGFLQAASNEPMYRALVLQLLCNGLITTPQPNILGEVGNPILDDSGSIIFFQ